MNYVPKSYQMQNLLALRRAVCLVRKRLTSESVESLALSFQSIDNIHGGDSLPLGVLGVGDSITNDIFKENLENTSGFFVDETRNSLDTSSSCQSTDGGLGDTLDIITKHFTMTFGSPLSQTFASLSSSRHDDDKLDM